MHYVYILKMSNGKLYTGRSDDLKRRIIEHNSGKVKSTKNNRPLKLIYYEAFIAKEDSIRREMYLKTSTGKRMLKLLLKKSNN
ncbi:MAG: GIY-YIG nuclease family protein [Candidatus Magasanikbacteria bacterium]